MKEITLSGCLYEPLMNYLKALGVLRLVAEQLDRDVRGFWRGDCFVLRTKYDRNDLIDFFITGYKATPILAPWNGGAGFIDEKGASFEILNRIRKSSSPFLAGVRTAIDAVEKVPIMRQFRESRQKVKDLEDKQKELKKQNRSLTPEERQQLRIAKTAVEQLKNLILSCVRNEFPEDAIRWLNACITLLPDDFATSPLLGSGGCDGRLEFSVNFLSNLLKYEESKPNQRQVWVEAALFGTMGHYLVDAAVGQYAPNRVGGPNATQGFEGPSKVNPFDFILMMEGAIIVTGAASCRYGVQTGVKAVFPFTVLGSAAGADTLASNEVLESRGELWLPLWSRPASLKEVAFVFSEGRADLRGRRVRTATDFARAVTSLGVDRGIVGFVRYSFLKRNGRAFLATPLGRFQVQTRRETDLLLEIDPWLDRFRSAVSNTKSPPRFRQALFRIESAIFDFSRYGGSEQFAAILMALGSAERELASSIKFCDDNHIPPITGLSLDWLTAASDGSVEFELALALSDICDPSNKVAPIRSNLEPVALDRSRGGRLYWTDQNQQVVWRASDLSTNLIAVLERRMMDGLRLNSDHIPLASRWHVSIEAISAFLEGQVNDKKIEDLLWGMILLNHNQEKSLWFQSNLDSTIILDRRYALLKLLFLPEPLEWKREKILVRPEYAILPMLRAGRVSEACTIAIRRLRSYGLVPMPYKTTSGKTRDSEWSDITANNAMRLAASLILPISPGHVERLLRLVLRKESETTDMNKTIQGGY